jgi:MbtH protein
MDHHTDAELFVPVVNDEEQYSTWFGHRALPAGWRVAGDVGTRAECLSFINRVWTDMRPRSLRTPPASGGKE